jgi:hypothetical protein
VRSRDRYDYAAAGSTHFPVVGPGRVWVHGSSPTTPPVPAGVDDPGVKGMEAIT